MSDSPEQVTHLLDAINEGDDQAAAALMPVVYDELRRLAQRYMQNERPGHTLQATALVHEAYVRLVGADAQSWESRRHFFNAAALAMRRILLDQARRKSRLKHGGGQAQYALESVDVPVLEEFGLEQYEAVDAALSELGSAEARWADVVHMRLFLGLSVEQTAGLLDVSPATVKNDWRFALTWLRTRVGGRDAAEAKSPSAPSADRDELVARAAKEVRLGERAAASATPATVTHLLGAIKSGDREAWEDLLALVYDDLRVIAKRSMRRGRDDHTLQPTALVHEAYLKLVDQRDADFNDREHFFAVASSVIRRILVDHARARKAAKRGGDWQRLPVEGLLATEGTTLVDVLELEDALMRLRELDEQLVRIVELRFFGGLTAAQAASVLNISKRSADRAWQSAREWLLHELDDAPPDANTS